MPGPIRGQRFEAEIARASPMAYAASMGHRRRAAAAASVGRILLAAPVGLSPPLASPALRSPTCCGRAAQGRSRPTRRRCRSPSAASPSTSPPAAIRFTVQRRPGTQDARRPRFRVALADAARSGDQAVADRRPGRSPTGCSSPSRPATARCRRPSGCKTIYPRYADAACDRRRPTASACKPFRDGTPYQGEDLILDPAAPERFLLRCTRQIAANPGMCLHERRIGGADMTVRFPRDWLADWRDGRRRHRPADRGLPPDAGARLVVDDDRPAVEIDVEDRQFENVGSCGPSRFRETARRGTPRRDRLPANPFSSAASPRGCSRCRTCRRR